MQKILDDYKMGVHLLAIKLQDVTPPEKVKPSFDDVNAAVQDASQTINIANRELTKLTQEEQGKAEQMIKTAEAYKVDVVNRAKGDAARFTSLYEEFKKAPDITRKRLYFEAIQDALKKTSQVYVVDPEVKSVVPLLQAKGQ
jgi:membrane protease subunit HflK